MGWFILKFLLFANTDWYLYNFRKSLAAALRDCGHRVILVSPAGPYGAKLRSLGFDWVAAPMDRGSLNPFRELTLLAWLWSFMRREQPDIVHSFTIKCAVYGALAGRLVGARCVNSVAGMGYVFTNNELKARVLRPPLRALMRAALGGEQARLVLQNPDDVYFFERSNIAPRERIRLICGSGVDCSRFVAPSEAPIRAEGAIRVVLGARMLWDKGVAEFVEAARMLKDENRSVHFLLAGAPDEGNPAAVPERKLREWQAEGLVQWLGHVGDMPALLASVDIVVLPSYREGLPKTLIEAAACARALITTDAPGCREVVTHEIDGLLVPVGDTKALASAIARLLDQPELARRLGEAARKKALSKFDEQIVIAQTFAVYEELTAQ
ncbi:glycosyltransferase family 4 protein [Methylosinus sporium]|uniref:Glycosyltransferase family 4 protein n=1 Tax=Methylosinus sporium TaxID=428 RepID=A0A549SHG4_METSR|nr:MULTISPECIES: glycosyltransferase family 4 protein [Methylosinus]MBU3888542.1 glycosyltransferase family 4 protein [Methylosinus sp. KRF6]TRL29071.1 glycosyltransferase family 4 protein [Methylosinus sporium]